MASALVLGGGGVTGISWELGVLHGLAEAGVDLTVADMLVGTSAGSVVAVQATTRGVADAFAAQFEPAPAERTPRTSPVAMGRLARAIALRGREQDRLARIGQMVLRARPSWTAQGRLDAIRHRIGDVDWPDRDVRICTIEAETGQLTVFDRTDGVDLYRVVTASCAVPFISPPVMIGTTHHYDGGLRSATNADVADGVDVMVVLAPTVRPGRQLDALRRRASSTGARRVEVLLPDRAARKAMGIVPLDPSKRAASAEAGYRQAAEFLSSLPDLPFATAA